MNEQEMNQKALESYPNLAEQSVERNAFRKGFKACSKTIESLPKTKGWVAKDKVGHVILFEEHPNREEFEGKWCSIYGSIYLESDSFTELTWEDEPIEIELIIRKL